MSVIMLDKLAGISERINLLIGLLIGLHRICVWHFMRDESRTASG